MAVTTGTDPGTALPGGLVLRTAQPRDLQQIGELLVDRGEPADALDHRLVVEDPEAGWDTSAVVVDGDRVVSTATLLDERLRIADLVLTAGQVELVATLEEYEGRGLVRALMGWAHARSAALGHDLQVMIGIPYFYRLFGYEYAIDIPPALRLHEGATGTGTGTGGNATLRPATAADLPALEALQEAAQAGFDVAVPHSPARRRWLLAHEGSTTWVLERDGTTVATGRTTPPDEGVLLAEAAATDLAAALELLRAVAALSPGDPVSVVDRPGTVAATAWADLVDPTSGPGVAEQYYVRIPDAGMLLERLRPVLEQRLRASGLDRSGGEVVLSTYGRHYRFPVAGDSLGPVVVGGPMQSPGVHRGAGVAPDHLGALVFGAGMRRLSQVRPDVYPGPDVELFSALFPPVTADLLTYYLPY